MGKILIVDDDHGTTKLLELILAKEGYDVVSVNNSGDTLTTALLCDPNLILLDHKQICIARLDRSLLRCLDTH